MAKGVELAVGYISLVAETKDLSTGINRTFADAGRSADSAGKQIGSRMSSGIAGSLPGSVRRGLSGAAGEADNIGASMGKRMGSQMAGALGGALKAGLATAGVVGGLASLTAALSSSVRSGTEFTTNMNKLQGVTGASADTMAKFGEKARELGNDTSLVGVSAQTATQAMVELAKGGFSANDAMESARGTLQLAAAAQISAAEAATIQADALHAFGLKATDAAKVADVLANVANASTGEMTDFAYGFQAGGAVMHQFGISVEDAAATLGLLANAGIKSSDAGTLVKSMLLAIASPSEQAAGALDELGVSAFDAQGNFVGMRTLLEQFQAAAQRMTPEMYALYTSTALGSDAARLAGIAAEQGGEGFDQMAAAVSRQGSAAALAAANTQGLPGVFERLSNTADRARLAVFDLLDGPLQSLGNLINTSINSALDQLEGHGDGFLSDLADAAKEAWPGIKKIGEALAHVIGSIGSGAWEVLERGLSVAADVAKALAPALEAIGGFLGDHSDLVASVAVAWAGWKFIPSLIGSIGNQLSPIRDRLVAARTAMVNFREEMAVQQNLAARHGQSLGSVDSALAVIESRSPAIQRMGDAYRSSATHATNFGRAVGVAKAAVSGMSQAVSGVINMLGGPWGAALTAATIGVTLYLDSVSEANRSAQQLAENAKTIKSAGDEMYRAFARNGGSIDDSVIAKMTEQVTAFQSTLETQRRGASLGDWMRSALVPTAASLFDDQGVADALNKQKTAEAVEAMIQVQQRLGLTNEQVSRAITGGGASWEILTNQLRDAGDAGMALLGPLEQLRQRFLDNQTAARNLTPGMQNLSDAIHVLADSSSTAEQKTNALKQALDLLAGKQPDVARATDTYNQTVRQTTEATQAAWDATKGWGAELVNADGSVNTTTENGHNLYEALNRIKDATVGVAASGGDLKAAFRSNDEQFRKLAEASGLTEQQVRRMAEAMGLVPDRIETLISAKDEASEELTAIKEKLKTLPPGQSITVDAITDSAKTALESVGVKLQKIDVNGHKQVVITAPTTAAISELDALLQKMRSIPAELKITSYFTGTTEPRGYTPPVGTPVSQNPGAGGWINYRPGRRATGGPIHGPGTSTSDSIPILASDDEHMWSAAEVRGAGGHGAVMGLRSMARSGELAKMLRGYKDGGEIKLADVLNKPAPIGPDDPRADPRPGEDPSPGRGHGKAGWPDWSKDTGWGAPPADWWLKPIDPENILFPEFMPPGQRDEWLDRWGKNRKKWKLLGLEGFEDGGPIKQKPGTNSIAAIDAAFAASGLPYQYGGANPAAGGMDCSGFLSYIYANMTGKDPGVRYFDTEANFEALGFVPGYQPGSLNIGIYRGGGGPNSHMAGELPNGIAVESGGNGQGVRYGNGASVHGFPLIYHLPLSPDDPGLALTGSAPGAPGGDNSSTHSGTGAPPGPFVGGTAEMTAAPALPETGATRTEGYIPAGAGSTGVAGTSFVSGLLNLGADAINGLIDQAASAASSAAGAAIAGGTMGVGAAGGSQAGAAAADFAIGLGADAAKKGVSYGFQMLGIGADALIEQLFPFGAPRWLGYDYTGFIPQMPNIAAATTTAEKAQAQQSAVDPNTTEHGQALGAPPGPTPTDIGMQPGGPVQPGQLPGGGLPQQNHLSLPPGVAAAPGTSTLEQQQDDSLLHRLGIYDQGGILGPGDIGANLTRKPEIVLTGRQWDDISAAAANVPLEPAAVPGNDYSVRIENVTVKDVNELQREIDSRQRLQMMRYAGRP